MNLRLLTFHIIDFGQVENFCSEEWLKRARQGAFDWIIPTLRYPGIHKINCI